MVDVRWFVVTEGVRTLFIFPGAGDGRIRVLLDAFIFSVPLTMLLLTLLTVEFVLNFAVFKPAVPSEEEESTWIAAVWTGSTFNSEDAMSFMAFSNLTVMF